MNIIEASKTYKKLRRNKWYKDSYIYISDISFGYIIKYGSADKDDVYEFTPQDLQAEDWEVLQ